jgi:putative nucleotidyltransferase with HDIG domain
MPTSILQRKPQSRPTLCSSPRETVLHEPDQVESYPPLSDTTARALALVNNGDCSVAEVARILQRDWVVTARVLQAANSWVYRGRKPIEDVQQAVLRLGLQECGKLLCAMGMRGMYAEFPHEVQQRCDALLRHSLFVARLASGACRDAGITNPGAAFTAGLFHDIGRLVACVKRPFQSVLADPIDFREDADTLKKERQVFGTDHCALGFDFATRNGLPEGVIRAVLNHHRPAEEDRQPELVTLVAVMDRVANHVQREHNIKRYEVTACPFFRLMSGNWTPRRVDDFRTKLPGLVVQSLRDTRQMLKSAG